MIVQKKNINCSFLKKCIMLPRLSTETAENMDKLCSPKVLCSKDISEENQLNY